MKTNTLTPMTLGAVVPNAGKPVPLPITSMHQAPLPMAIAATRDAEQRQN
jgi:hypothetical protein